MPVAENNVTEEQEKPIDVLYADPDEKLCSLYRTLGTNFVVQTVNSELECLTSLRQCVADVLVLEPQLPGAGGAAVLARIQATPEWSRVLVMILTSCRDVTLLKTISPYRISDYQVKPISCADLALRIRTVLRFRELRELETANSAFSTDNGNAFSTGVHWKRSVNLPSSQA